MMIKPAFALLSLGAAILGAVCAAAAHGTTAPTTTLRAPRVVTLASAGKTITVPPGSLVLLRLDHQRWRWSTPHAVGVAMRIEAIDYERDPGFDEWKIRTPMPGRATITVRGDACQGCNSRDRVFRFVLAVSSS